MNPFNYGERLPRLLTPAVVNTIAAIHEYRGRQVQLSRVKPAALHELTEIAKIQSTGASNRIENISTSEKRLYALMTENVAPKNRDEREILGYRYVLDLIHESHHAIDVTPGVILQLHRDLYRNLSDAFAGYWKDADNVIQEIGPDGIPRVRFKPASALETPFAVERLCEEYNIRVVEGVFDPLLLTAVFVFDFVSIHPFNDGNGRMSRLLTLLLLYRSGFDVGKYISIEREIERSKRTYYEALKASSCGWYEGECDYLPFVRYLLGVILACYKELDERAKLLDAAMPGEERVRLFFSSRLAPAAKRELLEALPMLTERTATRALQALQKEGYIERLGAARATVYRRTSGA